MTDFRRPGRLVRAATAAFLLALGAAGCGGAPGATLTQSAGALGGEMNSQTIEYNQAFIMPRGSGRWELILVRDGGGSAKQSGSETLEPVQATLKRQVMRLQVDWPLTSLMGSSNPARANATVSLALINSTDGSRIDYSGTAMVDVQDAADGKRGFAIEAGTLRVSKVTGATTAPSAVNSMRGPGTAQVSEGQVKAIDEETWGK